MVLTSSVLPEGKTHGRLKIKRTSMGIILKELQRGKKAVFKKTQANSYDRCCGFIFSAHEVFVFYKYPSSFPGDMERHIKSTILNFVVSRSTREDSVRRGQGVETADTPAGA